MDNVVKKSFAIFQKSDEEKYLEKMYKSGFSLNKFNGSEYYFDKSNKKNVDVLIEFYKNEQEIKGLDFYEKQGYKFICEYKGSKGTFYYYILDLENKSLDNIIYRKDDFLEIIEKIKKRIEVFWLIIISSIMLFSAYMSLYYKIKEFYVLNLVSLVGFSYILYMLFDVNRKYKIELRKLNLKKE